MLFFSWLSVYSDPPTTTTTVPRRAPSEGGEGGVLALEGTAGLRRADRRRVDRDLSRTQAVRLRSPGL
jgi:hypothetical protein